MNNPIVSDGHLRWAQNKSVQARQQELWKTVFARHAAQHARAGLFGKIAVRWRVHREYVREWKKISPSPHALFSTPLNPV